MKLLLVVPYKDNYMGVAQYPPIGLGYLAGAAAKHGHQVKILDCVKDRIGPAQFRQVIAGEEFDVAGFTVWSLALASVRESLSAVKQAKPKATIILGGPHPSALPAETLDYFKDADFAFQGEAELGLPAFLDKLAQGRGDFTSIPGLVYRLGAKVVANAPKMQEDLDGLGFPSWDLINPREYFRPGSLIGKDTAVLTCTRGCPYSCTFCSAWITAGRKIRKRSISHIMQEIEHLHSNYGIKIFDIPDENFTFDREYVMDFCEAVISDKRNFEFFLPNGIRLDSLDRGLLLAMRKARFRREVAVGIESGSQRVLKLMKKNLSLDVVREKVKLLHQAGFRPIGYFIMGFPGETKVDMEKTLALAMELKLYAAAFTPFAPMPGTEATTELIKRGEIPIGFDFSQITTDKVSYSPVGMTREELDSFRKRALLKFNLRARPLFYYLGNYNSFKFALAKFTNLFIKGGQV